MSGMSRENRLFTTTVTVSLLVHIVALWFSQEFVITGSEKSFTPTLTTFDVAIQPVKASQVRTVGDVQNKHGVEEKVSADYQSVPAAKLNDVQNKGAPLTTVAEAIAAEAEDSEPPVAASASVDEPGGAVAAESTGSASQHGVVVDTSIRDRYLASVLAQIETHKFYPMPARRRGLQGRVNVRFTLDVRGGISGLDVTGSDSLFVVAARAAINSALPLPAAPSADGFPLAVHYQMIFNLQ